MVSSAMPSTAVGRDLRRTPLTNARVSGSLDALVGLQADRDETGGARHEPAGLSRHTDDLQLEAREIFTVPPRAPCTEDCAQSPGCCILKTGANWRTDVRIARNDYRVPKLGGTI